MYKEQLSPSQLISLIILFLSSSSLFMGAAGESGNSGWIALLIAIALAVPLMLIYARLQVLLPGKDLFDMLTSTFGNVAGKAFGICYIWYSFHLGAMVLCNFGEFSSTVALTSTPMIVAMAGIGLPCIWAVRSGIEVLGRTAKLLLIVMLTATVVVYGLSVSKLEYHHLKPLLDSGWKPVISDAFGSFTFPFGEIIVVLGAFHAIPRRASAKKILLIGMLTAALIMVVGTVRNLLVLGPDILSSLYFPSYVAVSRINVGNFLQRIEGSAAFVFVMALLIKVGLCLFMASNGTAKLFHLKTYRSVVLQLGLLMIYLAAFVYENIMEMQYFAYHIYKIYALPFQVIIPGALLAVAEIKYRRGGGNPPEQGPEQEPGQNKDKQDKDEQGKDKPGKDKQPGRSA